MRRFADGRDWFFEHRFGLFIHWGIYAVDGWQEQDIFRRHRTRVDYDRLVRRFNPAKFNPDAWLDLAQQAGMTYLCFTTKHIDGFCMWDTAQTTYSVMHTPYGKDVLAMLADACRRRGFPLCLYYSVVDMHHPSYPNAGQSYEFAGPQPGDPPDLARYFDFLRTQVRELCTRYGKIHGFWWDGNVRRHRDPSINAMIRELQPGIIINNRGMDDGDFGTPERDWDESVQNELRLERPTEACQALGSQSWGYRRREDYYTDKHIIRSLANVLAKGGNYLLNTGPKADGTIAHEDARMLREIGRWHQAVREALFDVEPCSHLVENRNVLLTRRGNTLYVILHKEPVTRAVDLLPLTALPRAALLLNTGKPVRVANDMLPWQYKAGRGYLCLHDLPPHVLNATVPVIRLDFDQDFAGDAARP